jgi:hypothetical protein
MNKVDHPLDVLDVIALCWLELRHRPHQVSRSGRCGACQVSASVMTRLPCVSPRAAG